MSNRSDWFLGLAVAVALFFYSTLGRTQSCETGHWIDAVMADGEIIKLEDGSLWQVDSVDMITSGLWLPISDVLICGDHMINTDDNESVGVRRLR